jgi:hypothetical protein
MQLVAVIIRTEILWMSIVSRSDFHHPAFNDKSISWLVIGWTVWVRRSERFIYYHTSKCRKETTKANSKVAKSVQNYGSRKQTLIHKAIKTVLIQRLLGPV